MNPLVIIPARGGSKGIPGKNIKMLGDRPLIQYTIDAAREIFSDKVICVSTDDLEIKKVVESIGLEIPFLRPSELATDTAGTQEVLIHAINFYDAQGYNPDIIILLQATSPFRTGTQIREAMQIFDNTCEMVVSVKETKVNPYYLLYEENLDGWLEKSKKGSFITRQECPPVYELNGAIYITTVENLKQNSITNFTRIRKYVMDEFTSIDIDNQIDWELARIILEKYR
ncbi:MAG TPA: acylneuraminate cytidylyltransferase family protein [Bacteroidales bacterium]|nr:acylneuraminate cytidylyltransferase family protein [Bacteroidales bacterium]